MENKAAAKAGGAIAGDARKKLEARSGNKVSSKDNYLSSIDQTFKLDT